MTELICITCPRSCRLHVEKSGSDWQISGNMCPRGKAYAIQEMTDPRRTVTAVMRCDDPEQPQIPVRTDKPYPQTQIPALLNKLYSMTVKTPVAGGEVIYTDPAANINIIASESRKGQTGAVKFISHRGESIDAPENSLAAFRLAAERKTDGIETDIHFSADEVIVCSHDPDLRRICNSETVIAQTSFADLQQYDIGNGEKLPRFTDLLQTVNPGQQLYVEIKPGDLRIIPAMMAAVDASPVSREQVVVISFQRAAIREFKTLYPEQPALLLAGLRKEENGSFSPAIDETFDVLKKYCPSEPDSLLETVFAAAGEALADGIDVRGFPDVIDISWVKKFHHAGMYFAVWTIDNASVAEYFAGIGVDSITSNCAAKIRDELS